MPKYGIPYRGNKSRIADIIIGILPSGKRLVDLFGGGCAITHCALLSGKWDEILYNDINPLPFQLFSDAIHGKLKYEHRVITREQFHAMKEQDAYVAYCWSFSNNAADYLWGRDIETVKQTATKMLIAESLSERYTAYREFLRMLGNAQRMERLESLQRLQSLQSLQSLQRLQRLQSTFKDYREYEYRDGDVVYCDIPYEGTDCKSYRGFDNSAFYEWAKAREHPVYFSSYPNISGKGFYKIELKQVQKLTQRSEKVTECLYSNRPFDAQEQMTIFGSEDERKRK